MGCGPCPHTGSQKAPPSLLLWSPVSSDMPSFLTVHIHISKYLYSMLDMWIHPCSHNTHGSSRTPPATSSALRLHVLNVFGKYLCFSMKGVYFKAVSDKLEQIPGKTQNNSGTASSSPPPVVLANCVMCFISVTKCSQGSIFSLNHFREPLFTSILF